MPSQLQKLVYLFCCLATLLVFGSAQAMLSMELTRGVAGAIPVAVLPFHISPATSIPTDVSSIVANDLRNSGRFTVSADAAGVDAIVSGTISQSGNGRYISILLSTAVCRKKIRHRVRFCSVNTLRWAQQIYGLWRIISVIWFLSSVDRGARVFFNPAAYVVVQRQADVARYTLEISDEDGYNPRPLLTSSEPIMSPAFSPDGRKIAYVSFENRRRPFICKEIATGRRVLLSAFPGINGCTGFFP